MHTDTRTAGRIWLLPQESILPNKNQPRKHFNGDALEGLAESIRQNGILQPLLVRPLSGDLYELIAGERRLRAARLVGMQEIPCVVLRVSDEKSSIYALLENLQRQDLDCFEEAEAITHIMLLYDLSQEALAATLGKAPSTVSNKLRLLRLPENVRNAVIRYDLSERHARELLRLQTEEQMMTVVETIHQQNMTVQQAIQYIDRLLTNNTTARKKPIALFKDIRIFVNTINHAVDTMRSAGIAADAKKNETNDYIEYTIRIPKTAAANAAN